MIYIGVFFLQVAYIIIKFMGIRHIVSDNLASRLVITSVASLVWLLATALSVGALIAENYWIILPYILGNLLGVLIEDKVRRKL